MVLFQSFQRKEGETEVCMYCKKIFMTLGENLLYLHRTLVSKSVKSVQYCVYYDFSITFIITFLFKGLCLKLVKLVDTF